MIDWNLPNELIESAFKELVEGFNDQLREEIEAEKWEWSGITNRKVGAGRTGKIAGSPRDIVDTGDLRDSQSFDYISPIYALYQWNVDHAAIVHQGAVLNNGSIIIARPFTKTAQQEYNLLDNFTNLLKDKL